MPLEPRYQRRLELEAEERRGGRRGTVQGYLAHKKPPNPPGPPEDPRHRPKVGPRGGGGSYGRGTPVGRRGAASAGARCSGFRVQGAGFRVQGSGFGVQGSRFRVQGSGFRVQVLNNMGQGKGTSYASGSTMNMVHITTP